MRASGLFSHELSARATSGQQLRIRYDPLTNAMVFVEDDWSVDGRGAASPRTTFREPVATRRIRRLPRRAA